MKITFYVQNNKGIKGGALALELLKTEIRMNEGNLRWYIDATGITEEWLMNPDNYVDFKVIETKSGTMNSGQPNYSNIPNKTDTNPNKMGRWNSKTQKFEEVEYNKDKEKFEKVKNKNGRDSITYDLGHKKVRVYEPLPKQDWRPGKNGKIGVKLPKGVPDNSYQRHKARLKAGLVIPRKKIKKKR